ncbi:ABC transporter substrate-binding protein [Xylophilus sp. ASV27]|uniref:ABC transporter substrate-binding protein n=1 Tax=Xylophilus sp. ASV27 TaxID=2795129 RepID=UPI001E5F14A5|nr:ABC transporter substrate-binding protein [Xylophilus sp. ASV27]
MTVPRTSLMNRRGFHAAASLAAAALAAPALLRTQPVLERTRVSIAVGGKGSFYFLPLTIAEQLGYFRAEGLEVEISDFAGGSRALQAVVGGLADVCCGAFEHTVSLQSKGRFFRSFVLMGRAPQIVVGVSHRTMGAYRTAADLRGRRIGVTSLGSSTNMQANLLLLGAGVKPSEVSFVGVGSSMTALTALRSGQIDAISNVDPIMTVLEQKGDIRVICDTRTLKGAQEVFGGPMPAACLYAPEGFADKNPGTAQALASAVVHALKWIQTAGPSDILRTVPERYLLGDRALYLSAFGKVREAISPDGMVPEQGPVTAVRALANFDPAVRVGKIDQARLFTNEFARRAKGRFQA